MEPMEPMESQSEEQGLPKGVQQLALELEIEKEKTKQLALAAPLEIEKTKQLALQLEILKATKRAPPAKQYGSFANFSSFDSSFKGTILGMVHH